MFLIHASDRHPIGSRAIKETATAENVRLFGLFRCGFHNARNNNRLKRGFSITDVLYYYIYFDWRSEVGYVLIVGLAALAKKGKQHCGGNAIAARFCTYWSTSYFASRVLRHPFH